MNGVDGGGARTGGPIRRELRRQVPSHLARHATIAARGSAIAAGALARRTYAGIRRDPALAHRSQVRTAQQVAELLGDMRGAVMKLGQAASFVDPQLPPVLAEALHRLHDDAPRMAPELVDEVVTAELGAPPSEIFATWDPEAFAAASIGQVHRAITADGRAVAVKVQFPGVGEAIRTDLASARLLLAMLRPLAPGLDPDPVLAELRARIGEELDYRVEAANQIEIAAGLAGHPHLAVPAVHPELSSERVLTTDLVTGHSYRTACTWDRRERDLAGESLFRAAEHGFHVLGCAHADPHPGNVVFHGEGRITLLDFGMVRRFSPEERQLITDMTRTWASDHDAAAFERSVVAAGYLPADHHLDLHTVARYFGHFYALVADDRPVTVTSELVQETFSRYVDVDRRHRDVLREATIPGAMTILQRIYLGNLGLLAGLRATANWRRLAAESWPWERRAPETELGRAHAAWLERTREERDSA